MDSRLITRNLKNLARLGMFASVYLCPIGGGAGISHPVYHLSLVVFNAFSQLLRLEKLRRATLETNVNRRDGLLLSRRMAKHRLKLFSSRRSRVLRGWWRKTFRPLTSRGPHYQG